MRSATRMPRWRVTLSVTALALAAGGLAGVPIAAQSPEPSPIAGAFAEGATPVDFWTEHTPPDSDGLQSDRRRLQRGEPRRLRDDDDRAGQRDRHRQAADLHPWWGGA